MKQVVTKVISHLVFFFVVIVLLPISVSRADIAAGKKVFLDSKCNKCHAVKDQGIKVTPKVADADADADKEEEGDKIEPPDLSKLEAPYMVPGVLAKFLKKQVAVASEVSKGKAVKHKKSFTGSDADLANVIEFVTQGNK